MTHETIRVTGRPIYKPGIALETPLTLGLGLGVLYFGFRVLYFGLGVLYLGLRRLFWVTGAIFTPYA